MKFTISENTVPNVVELTYVKDSISQYAYDLMLTQIHLYNLYTQSARLYKLLNELDLYINSIEFTNNYETTTESLNIAGRYLHEIADKESELNISLNGSELSKRILNSAYLDFKENVTDIKVRYDFKYLKGYKHKTGNNKII